jgi:hypothetical protein
MHDLILSVRCYVLIPNLKRGFLVLLIIWLMPTLGWSQTSLPDLVRLVRVTAPLDFCGEAVPLGDSFIRERFEKEMLLSLWDRDQAVLWLKRSRRFLPVIETMLQEAGLPVDLQYVAVAESALRPHAGSPKGAIGFWQFIPETGRKYGLTVNARIDERRSLIASTRAAIAYFSALYADLGSWALAVAAFNMGEEGLKAEMLAQDVEDFYRLYLPLETQRHLFRVLSAKLIIADPERYGFYLQPKDYYAPRQTEPIELTCWDETSVTVVAQAANTDFKMIKDLNPAIRGYYLAAGTYQLALPAGAAEGFQARFDRHFKAWQARQLAHVYVVEEGDNLTRIAERFQVPLPALLIWNRRDARQPIHPGDRLIIHPAEKQSP